MISTEYLKKVIKEIEHEVSLIEYNLQYGNSGKYEIKKRIEELNEAKNQIYDIIRVLENE